MAISQMQKVTVITLKNLINDLLTTVQQLEYVHVNNLKQHEEWQIAETNPAYVEFMDEVEGDFDDTEWLQQLAKRKERIEKAIVLYQAHLTKPSLWQTLRSAKPSLSFKRLEQHGEEFNEQVAVDRATNLTQRLSVLQTQVEIEREQIALLTKWQKLELLPTVNDQQMIQLVVGTVPGEQYDRYYKDLAKQEDLVVQRVFNTAEEVGVAVFTKDLEEGDLVKRLAPYQFKAIDYPFDELPVTKLPKLEAEHQQTKETLATIQKELAASQEVVAQLQVQLDYLANRIARYQARQLAGETHSLVAIEGWIEQRNVGAFQQAIKAQYGDLVVLRFNEVSEAEMEEVPVKLINHPVVEPFETVTKMYALPKYNEIDPTPFLTPFYVTFFGMMVADLGYGLLMVVAMLAGLILFKSDKLVSTLKFYLILGISTSVWGLIYGSFFGFTLPVQFINTSTDVTTVLALSVGFGFVQIIVGLLLNTYQQAKRKETIEAYTGGLAWVMILFGLAAMAVGMIIPEYQVVAEIGKWVAIINAVGIVIASIIKAKSLAGLGAGLYNLYGASGYIGDLVSYTRLMALGLSGGSIGAAFNLIIAFLPPLARFSVGILLFVVLHGVNIFLSLLSGYVHGARLMFVEFFGKFYQGGGKAFTPLAPVNQHVKATKEQTEE